MSVLKKKKKTYQKKNLDKYPAVAAGLVLAFLVTVSIFLLGPRPSGPVSMKPAMCQRPAQTAEGSSHLRGVEKLIMKTTPRLSIADRSLVKNLRWPSAIGSYFWYFQQLGVVKKAKYCYNLLKKK